jgi:hypothetical protein
LYCLFISFHIFSSFSIIFVHGIYFCVEQISVNFTRIYIFRKKV